MIILINVITINAVYSINFYSTLYWMFNIAILKEIKKRHLDLKEVKRSLLLVNMFMYIEYPKELKNNYKYIRSDLLILKNTSKYIKSIVFLNR